MAKNVVLLKNKTIPVDHYNDLFSQSNYTPVFLPLLKHSPVNQDIVLQFLKSDHYIHNFKAFIITSQRCVEALDTLIQILRQEKFDKLQQVMDKPAYTVGPTTFKILKELGFTDIRGGSEAGNGSILSDIIINDSLFKDSDNKQILFLTGEIRRDIIPKKLQNNKFALTELVAYKTEPLDDIVNRYSQVHNEIVKKEIIEGSSDNWLIFFSPQGTEDIVEHLKSHKGVFKLASIGPTTQEYLEGHGLIPDIVARKPDAAHLLDAITKLS